MSDMNEKLILYIGGELTDEEKRRLEEQLRNDPDLAEELAELRSSIELVEGAFPAEPEAGYWRSFYNRLEPRLESKNLWLRLSDRFSFGGVRFAGFGVAAALVIAVVTIFIAQTMYRTDPVPQVTTNTVTIKRAEGVLEHIVSNHLDRSRLLLQEMVNLSPEEGDITEMISETRSRGEQLLSDTRTYRLAAQRQDDAELVALLNELELVLIEIANLDPDAAEYALPSVKRIIKSKNLLIKIEIINLNEPVPATDPASLEV